MGIIYNVGMVIGWGGIAWGMWGRLVGLWRGCRRRVDHGGDQARRRWDVSLETGI